LVEAAPLGVGHPEGGADRTDGVTDADARADRSPEEDAARGARRGRIAGEDRYLADAPVLGAPTAHDPDAGEEPGELRQDRLRADVVGVGEEDEEAPRRRLAADRLGDGGRHRPGIATRQRDEEATRGELAADREDGDAVATLDLLLRGE